MLIGNSWSEIRKKISKRNDKEETKRGTFYQKAILRVFLQTNKCHFFLSNKKNQHKTFVQ